MIDVIRRVDWGGASAEYRYTLWVIWDDFGKLVQFIGLNPSTADEQNDDPTLRKCIGFAKRWGMGSICMTNLFAWRDTKPQNMKRALNPIGILNDYYITEVANVAEMTIAAWGNEGVHLGRDKEVRKLISNLKALKINKATGQPAHPLYIPYETTLVPFDENQVLV